MSVEKIKALYEDLHASIEILQDALGFSYVEALHETLQNITDGEVQQIDDEPNDEVADQLRTIYQHIDWQALSPIEIRKGIQLAFLEGERKDALPSNYQMTPEAIAILIGFFAVKLVQHQKFDQGTVQLFDPVIGTGNLWSIVAQELMRNGIKVEGDGYDNDDLLLSVAEKSLALQGLTPSLYLGDSLQNLMARPAHIIVADLPVGYYPVDEVAANFSAATNKGDKQEHAYAHYLLVEQSMRYLQDSGWGIFLVPSNIFTGEHSMTLIKAIGEYGYFQALLNLPSTLFKSAQARKSILIVQKNGSNAKQAEKVLIGDIPSLKDEQRMPEFLNAFNNWLKSMA